MDAVALAAGEVAHPLLLIRADEVEAVDVGAAVHLARPQHNGLLAAGDLLPHGLVGVQGGPALIHVAQRHRLADGELAAGWLLLAGDEPQQRGLARAVGADHPDHRARRGLEAEVLEEQPVAIRLRHAVKADHHIPQPRAGRDVDLHLLAALLGLLAQQLLVSRDAGLALGLPRGGRHADPLQLALQGADTPQISLLFFAQPLLLLLQPRGVVALPGDAVAAIQLQNPPGHVVQKVAVVRDRDDRARIGLQVPLQPRYRLRVQVVGRLVQQQDVWLGEQQPAERHPTPLAAGEDLHRGVARRAAQRLHRLLQPVVQVPGVVLVQRLLDAALLFDQRVEVRVRVVELLADRVVLPQEVNDGLRGFLHHLAHGLGVIQLRLLRQQTAGVALREHRLAQVVLIHAGHDAQQGALARAVQPQHADLRAVEEAERDVTQHLPVGRVHTAHAHHRVDDLLGFGHGSLLR